MAHQSINSSPLKLKKLAPKSPDDLAAIRAGEAAVWLLIMPYDPARPFLNDMDKWSETFKEFARNCHQQSVVCILTTATNAATLWPEIEHSLHYQLWVTVKLENVTQVTGKLPNHHAELLVLTKYHGSLKHTKTRIAYTYCPHCDRTTKDYGGKKHTYHEYGTLISDVWRDISCDVGKYPSEIVTRLRDLFGLEPYETLYAVDLRHAARPRSNSYHRTIDVPKTLGKTAKPTQTGTLVHGDCLEVLREMSSDSVDFCFADPPYNLRKKYDSWDDTLEIREYFEWCDKWLCELARVLKPGRTLAVLNIPQGAIRHYSFLSTVLDYQNWIVWEGLSLPVRMVMPANYAIVCFSKGKTRELPGKSHHVSPIDKRELLSLKELYCIRTACVRERRLLAVDDKRPITDLWWDIHRLKHNSRRADHPCQLPPGLMRRLIALFTRPNECVLDPFNGVGTTTLAAELLERSFVGIELSPVYHETAKKRHEELRQGLDPFRKRRRTPHAKNSPVQRLKKQPYAVPKKQLQLEVKRIALELGRMPKREEVESLGKYPIAYYDEYFISWGEACAAARTTGMSEIRNPKSRQPHPTLFQM